MSTADIASWHPGTVMQDFSLRAFATAARRRSAADIGMWQIDDFENQIILTPRHIMEPGLMASSPMINIWHGHHWSTNKTWPLVSSNLLNRLKQIHGGLSLIPWTSLHWFWVSMLLIANTFTARRLPWQRESWQRTPAKATNLCVGPTNLGDYVWCVTLPPPLFIRFRKNHIKHTTPNYPYPTITAYQVWIRLSLLHPVLSSPKTT